MEDNNMLENPNGSEDYSVQEPQQNNTYRNDEPQQNGTYPQNSTYQNNSNTNNGYPNYNNQYQQYQPYRQYQPYGNIPPYNDNGPELEEPVKIGEWVLSIFILMIPCVNIIMMFVWAFSRTEKKSKSNFFKAYLIFFAIVMALMVLFSFATILLETML